MVSRDTVPGTFCRTGALQSETTVGLIAATKMIDVRYNAAACPGGSSKV